MQADTASEFDAALRDANDALRRGAWQEGRVRFEQALVVAQSPEAYDGLATCCRFLGALDESLAARERAYRLYRARSDYAGATIAAAWLGRDSGLPRAELSVARSWFAVARRQVGKTDSVLARGTLDYYEGQFALLGENDAPKAGDLGRGARSAGLECGDLDLEMQGLSLVGVALVAEGRVAEGMALVEEAAAAVLGGELSGADVAGWICCHLIYACERVSDTRRAAEWCSTLRGFCERWEMPGMFGMCLAHHGSVLMHEGRWADAEATLTEASELFASAAPALGYEALVRLCDLRLRQGRFDEVLVFADLLDATPLGWVLLPHRAAVAVESGDRLGRWSSCAGMTGACLRGNGCFVSMRSSWRRGSTLIVVTSTKPAGPSTSWSTLCRPNRAPNGSKASPRWRGGVSSLPRTSSPMPRSRSRTRPTSSCERRRPSTLRAVASTWERCSSLAATPHGAARS
jgi:tetratricopeptide (TPR) repeat protein